MINVTAQKVGQIIALMCALSLPLAVSAQLNSTNYQVDSYSIGEAGGAYGTSTNYQTGSAESAVVYDQTTTTSSEETGTITSSGGGRNSSSDDDEDSSDSSNGTSTETVVPVVTTPTSVVPVIPYVPPVQEQYVEPPESEVTTVGANEVITFIPVYEDTDQSATNDQGAAQYYQAVSEDLDVRVTIPNGAFTIPSDYEGEDPYKVFIVVQEHDLPDAQAPDPSTQAIAVGDKVYTVSFIDVLKRRISAARSPLAIEFEIDDTLDYQVDTKGYFFNNATKAWVEIDNAQFTEDTITFLVQQPVLVGLWAGERLPSILPLSGSDSGGSGGDATATATTDQLTVNEPWWYPCQYFAWAGSWNHVMCWAVPYSVALVGVVALYFVGRRYLFKEDDEVHYTKQ